MSHWAPLALALSTPLRAAGAAPFTAHMAERELPMVVAPPPLVLARPVGVWLWAFPAGGRHTVGRTSRAAPARRAGRRRSASLHVAALWVWYVPVLFESALVGPVAHRLRRLGSFGSASLFWRAMLGRGRRKGRAGAAVPHPFATPVHASLLGALFLFSPRPWCPRQAAGGRAPRD